MLLCALADRLDASQQQTAGRLFLLHEAVHLARQGITSDTADGIGRLPRVLEEVDYLADVWALILEYARARQVGETTEEQAPEFFRRMLRLVTATFWAFDAAQLPLQAVQVRRLNRYLLWYWQRVQLTTADSLGEVLRILSNKPVLEVSGPRSSTSRGRVVFGLNEAYFNNVEFGALVQGFRVVRIGSHAGAPVRTLLNALRAGDEGEFISAPRGIFDTIQGAA